MGTRTVNSLRLPPYISSCSRALLLPTARTQPPPPLPFSHPFLCATRGSVFSKTNQSTAFSGLSRGERVSKTTQWQWYLRRRRRRHEVNSRALFLTKVKTKTRFHTCRNNTPSLRPVANHSEKLLQLQTIMSLLALCARPPCPPCPPPPPNNLRSSCPPPNAKAALRRGGGVVR